MPINTAAHRAPSAGRARLPILIAAWLLIAATALIGSGLPETAHAQAIRGAIPSPTLASNVPGQFVITWATPDPTPTDYRIRWANTDLGFPSYSAANEPERGNEYPLGDINTLTLSNLTPGDSYKIQIRSRYYNADRSVHESSGPWTSTATQRVMDEPAEPPQSDDQEPTPTPTPTPTPENDDPPAAPTGLTVSRVGHSVLTLTWNDPQDANITGYRILRGTAADSLSTIQADTGSPSKNYTDSTVEPETSYHYAVIAMSTDGNSAQSSAISATTPAAPKKKDPPPERVGPRQSITATEVPATWSLKPTAINAGDQFRLIFLSSTKRNGSPSTISNYNIFVQGLAAAGHTDIRTHSSGFKAVVCTASADARDNTSTTGTGVPIYWLNGAKVADDYTDFYDGSWDDEVNDKNESGTNGFDTSQNANHPLTGCNDNGTEKNALGSAQPNVGRPNSTGSGHGPLSSATNVIKTLTRPMYGISAVFQVAGATNTPAAGAPAITAPNKFRVPAVLGVDLSGITDTDGVTNIATNATYKWQRFNAAGTMLETDSIGTNATYTLTDTDATKTLKVVVNFTDDASNSEGPLTSAATSAITAAASCAAPTYVGGATQVWTAKVGVGKNSDFYGYYDDTSLDFGSLDQTRFSISPNNYRVDRVFTQPGPSLAFSMKSDFTSDEQKTLTLHICDQAFAFSVAGAPSSGSTYAFLESDFPGADLDWSTHAERTVYLSQDTAAPTFASATVNGSTLVVTFNEDLGAAASLINSAFTVKKGSSGTTQTLSGTPSISGSTVTLTLATAVTATDTDVKVAYTKPTSGSANKLVDKFGNETATFTDQVVTNLLSGTDTTPPTVTTAQTSATGGQIQLRFSENPKNTNLPPTSAFEVTTDGEPHATSGSVAVSMNLVFFAVSPNISQGQAVVVTYTDPTGGNDARAIQDAAGNDVETFTTGTNSVPAVTNRSTTAATAPEAPTSLTAENSGSIGSAKIDLSWTAPADNGGRIITGYKIEVSSDGGNAWTDHVATTGDNNTIYTHTGLPDGATRHYRVSAINSIGTSTASNVDSATTAGTAIVPRVLVSNTGQSGNSSTIISSAEQAQTFTTGTTSSTVTSVTIRSEDSEGDDVALKICETTGSSIPTTTCTDLTPPGTYPAGLLVFTAPDMALTPSTTYSVVFSSPDGEGVTLDATDSDNEDGSSLTGWSIRNRSQVKQSTTWQDRAFDRAIIIAINGRALTSNVAATGTPTISGTAHVSGTLTASTSDIRDLNGVPSTFNYQWKRYSSDGNTFESDIGVDSKTYTLTTAEEGKKVRVEVSFNDNANNREGPLLSAAYPGTGTVRAAPMPIQRTQREDRPYSFTESDFSNLPGGRVALTKMIITELPQKGYLARDTLVLLPSGNYQGQALRIYSRDLPLTFLTDQRRLSLTFYPEANRHGTPYASFKFKVNSSTVDHTMRINITPVNDRAYGRPYITGTTQVGYTLKAFTSSIGDRDGFRHDQLNYQWKRYAADGTTFEANIGANSNTYTLTNSEQGKKIKLEIRFTDNDGTDEGPLTSPAFPYIATQTVGEATFISTIGMAGDSFHDFTTQEQGQVFTTGTNPNGYTVTSVVIISEDSAGDDVALKICEVDESLHPTAVCTDLTAPGMSPAGPLVFTAPSGTTLDGGRTNYMVVISSPGGQHVRLDAHVSDGYDSNSLVGFSIRNRIHYKTGTGWQESSYRRGFRIAGLGTINP